MDYLKLLSLILFLIIPLLVAGVGHMIVVKKNWFPKLRVPINENLFGANKTWRGVIVMPVFTFIAVFSLYLLEEGQIIADHGFTDFSPYLGGPLLGLGYALFELPNSFIKRRMKIPPGKLPEDKKVLFYVLDHIDSATGCILVYHFFYQFPWWVLLMVVPVAIVIHTVINLLLYALKIRQNPF